MNQGEFSAVPGIFNTPLAQITAVVKQRQQNAENKQFFAQRFTILLRALVTIQQACAGQSDIQSVLHIVIAGITCRVAWLLTAIKPGNVVDCMPQDVGTGVGKEIEKYIHHRVTNRNRIGYVDGVGYIKIISTKLHTFCASWQAS